MPNPWDHQWCLGTPWNTCARCGKTTQDVKPDSKCEPPINPGIAYTVKWLNERGFKTMDSGDGETHDFECDQPYPYVHMEVDSRNAIIETDYLKLLLEENFGIKFTGLTSENDITSPDIVLNYSPVNGTAVLSLINVKLTEPK